MLKPLTVYITINCRKFLERWEYQTILSVCWENQNAGQETTVRTRHGTTDWFQIGKGVCQGCILTLRTIVHQAPLSMGFSRREYWSGLPGPPPGALPNPGIEHVSLAPPALQADSLPLSHSEAPTCRVYHTKCQAGRTWIPFSTSWNQDCWKKYQQHQICR